MDEDLGRKTVVALGGAALFIVMILAVGVTFGNGGLTKRGGLAIVGSLIAFVLIMSAAGYWLSERSA